MLAVYIGIVLIILFLGLYVVIWKRVNRAWVKHNGEEITAQITKVVPKKRGDYGLTYEVQASWTREKDGKVFEFFRGAWLRKNPEDYFNTHSIREVTVRIDPKMPATHYIVLEFLPEHFILSRGKLAI